jgi:hypothetical protein
MVSLDCRSLSTMWNLHIFFIFSHGFFSTLNKLRKYTWLMHIDEPFFLVIGERKNVSSPYHVNFARRNSGFLKKKRSKCQVFDGSLQ